MLKIKNREKFSKTRQKPNFKRFTNFMYNFILGLPATRFYPIRINCNRGVKGILGIEKSEVNV